MSVFPLSLLSLLLLFMSQPFTRSLPIHPKPRIVSGIKSKSSQFPFIAALRSIEKDRNGLSYMSEVWCGGSLLRLEYPATILTSGHCVHNTTKQLIVELNASNVHQTPIIGITAWPVIYYVIHQEFDLFLLDNDIALVFIDADLSQRHDLFVSTVTIPNLVDTECCSDNEILQTIGYGRTALDAAYSDTLEYTNIQHIDRAACNQQLCLWETHSTNCPWYYANTHNICGLGDATAPCHGDSGGPVVKKDTNEQVGIVSWGILCISTLPTILTNTGVYYAWIQQQLQLSLSTSSSTAAATTLPTITPTSSSSFTPTTAPTDAPTTVAPTALITESPTNIPIISSTTARLTTASSSTTSTTSTTRRIKETAPETTTVLPTEPVIESTIGVETTIQAPDTSDVAQIQSTHDVYVTTATPTRYSWKVPTDDALESSTAKPESTGMHSSTVSAVDNTVNMDTSAIWPTSELEILNPVDMAVLSGRTVDEYVIIIILAGITGVAIFIVGILCLQKYRCKANENDAKQAYDRVKAVSNPLVYTDEEEDHSNVPQAIECVAIIDDRIQITATNIEAVEDDHVIDDLMAETLSSQTPNNSLLSAFTLQSNNI